MTIWGRLASTPDDNPDVRLPLRFSTRHGPGDAMKRSGGCVSRVRAASTVACRSRWSSPSGRTMTSAVASTITGPEAARVCAGILGPLRGVAIAGVVRLSRRRPASVWPVSVFARGGTPASAPLYHPGVIRLIHSPGTHRRHLREPAQDVKHNYPLRFVAHQVARPAAQFRRHGRRAL